VPAEQLGHSSGEERDFFGDDLPGRVGKAGSAAHGAQVERLAMDASSPGRRSLRLPEPVEQPPRAGSESQTHANEE